jgi:hypothetical protein
MARRLTVSRPYLSLERYELITYDVNRAVVWFPSFSVMFSEITNWLYAYILCMILPYLFNPFATLYKNIRNLFRGQAM